MKALVSAIIFSISASSFAASYQSLTFKEKTEFLYQESSATAYDIRNLPAVPQLGTLAMLKLTSAPFLSVAFDRTSDFMPEGRKKLLHPSGSVGVVELRLTGKNPFTGILSKNALGIARLSLGVSPDGFFGQYLPGMALKFPVTGRPSVNLHVMHSLSGQTGSRDFFENTFSNIIAPPSFPASLLTGAFSLVQDPPNHLPIAGLGRVEQDGDLVSNANAPYQIWFIPSGWHFSKNTKADFRFDLAKIPVGTVLYEVWASESKDAKAIQVGQLVLKTTFVPSEFGDEKLFFQHQGN